MLYLKLFYTRLNFFLFRYFFSFAFPECFISFTCHLATKKVKKNCREWTKPGGSWQSRPIKIKISRSVEINFWNLSRFSWHFETSFFKCQDQESWLRSWQKSLDSRDQSRSRSRFLDLSISTFETFQDFLNLW